MGGGCGGRATVDLVLSFHEEPKNWIALEKHSSGPCEVSASPKSDGRWEFRLHYLNADGKKTLRTYAYQTSRNYIVDHWLEKSGTKLGGKKSKIAKSERIVVKGVPETQQLETGFIDENSWEAILGSAGTAFSFDSPELDRFRLGRNEINFGIPAIEIEKRELRVPLVPLPMLDDGPQFRQKKITPITYFKEDLRRPGLSERAVEGAVLSLNLVKSHFEKKEWLKAQQTLQVFEKSEFVSAAPLDRPEWWAIKGLIYLELGNQEKNADFLLYGMSVWREGLRTTAGKGGLARDYIDFMALETSRLLYEAKQYYGLAAFAVWTQRYRWKSETEERMAFLLAEAHYQLALYDEARRLFTEFLDTRKSLPLSAADDRRLIPIAAFRLGDCDLRMGNYNEAISTYTRSLGSVPSLERVSFEQSWYPGEVIHYPAVFLHRAEASIRIGAERNALKDLRAFVNFGGAHPDLGLVLFRTGEILDMMQPGSEKALVAWRECQFRVGDSLGGRLCQARSKVSELDPKNRPQWSRLVGAVEDAKPRENDPEFRGNWKNNLLIYLEILLANRFIELNEPFQALERLNMVRNLEASPFMMTWFREYTITALSGLMKHRRLEGRPKDVAVLYDQNKNRLLMKQNRHEILWQLANAFSQLQLWGEAWRSLKTAEELKARLGRKNLRPFEDLDATWFIRFVEVGAELLNRKEIAAAEVLPYLKKLPKDDPKALRAAIRFHNVSAASAEELSALERLQNLEPVTWEEFGRYLQLLEARGKKREYVGALEKRLGLWLSDVGADRALPPPPELFLRLFEARRDSDRQRAFVPLEYLLNLKPADRGRSLPTEMIVYRKAETLLKWGKESEAQSVFREVLTIAPDSLWAQKASAELKSLEIQKQKNADR